MVESPEFHVFLCHNSQDKPEVRNIAQQLLRLGYNPWFDEWHLQPGLPWQRELERQIITIRAAAVFVGKSGLGPWQEMEIEAYLRRFVKQGCPVIPVLLTNAPKQPELPIFLEGMTWVDFRHSELDPIKRLVWGITGIRPSKTPDPEEEADESVKPKQGKARYFIEELGNDMTLDMVAILGGTFMMGSPEGEGVDNERPYHQVTIKPFSMGKYLITQAQYQQVMGNNPSKFQTDYDHPVERVSWNKAVKFCQKLSEQTGKEYRLPTEAEWEYACRAGTITPYYFGQTLTDEQANFERNIETTTQVGSYPPNAFGLYDMHGNLWELCQDNWHDNHQGATIDGSARISGSSNIVIRGGSWFSGLVRCRSAVRDKLNRADIGNGGDKGFRIVCVSCEII